MAAAPTAADVPDGAWHGTVPGVERPRPSFTLTDTAGHPFDFAAATRGRATLLFFGYTNCPDVCPTTMADIAAAKKIVSPQVRAQLSVVFVTTDPARDTRGVIRRWLDQFDSSFTGLTGTASQVMAAQQAVGIPVAQAEQVPGGNYNVYHAAQVAAFGIDDRQKVVYFANAGVGDFAADLPRLATGK
jgi:protein SCO1/2